MTTTTNPNVKPMTQADVAAALDLEHQLLRTHGDLRNLLALSLRVAGLRKGTERIYNAVLTIDRAYRDLGDLFEQAIALDRETHGEPPF